MPEASKNYKFYAYTLIGIGLPMAHITEFKIWGLAGKSEVTHHKMNRDINVFFGANGCGKTSLLKILHSAMSADSSILIDVPFQKAEVKIFSIDRNKTMTYTIDKAKLKNEKFEINFDATSTGEFDTQEIAKSISEFKMSMERNFKWTSTSQEAPLRLRHRYLPISRLYLRKDGKTARQRPRDTSSIERTYEENFAESLSSLWRDFYYRVTKDVQLAQAEGLEKILSGILFSSKKRKNKDIDIEIAYERVKDFLGRQGSDRTVEDFISFSNRYSENEEFKGVVNRIDEVEGKIEHALRPINMLEKLISKLFGGGKIVRLADAEIAVAFSNGESINLASLSSGEKQVIKILMEAVIAEENTIIIDEPEISMHIDWQRNLLSNIQLLNDSCQLIVATHSPEIMAGVSDNNIFKI